MIVGKAVQMAQMMHVPILGLVENMSYAVCPDCGKHIHVFGDSHVDEIADKYSLPVLAKMPIDPELAKEADAGMIEVFESAFVFPGQGSQTVGMLSDMAAAYPVIEETVKPLAALGYDLWALAQQGPAEELNKTANPACAADCFRGAVSRLAAAGW